ncbi:MAG: hypothetical protein WBG86_10680, partial [Polyangiales bacterium]
MSIDVGVGQLVEELAQRGDRLPFEIGAFVALEACEGLLQEAVRLEADDVRVTAEGSVVVAASAERTAPDEAVRSLVSVLSRLLVAAGPGVPPHLLQLVRESAEGQHPRDLRHLHDAIEASLIPINRGASRRVLARLVRESDRPPAPEEAAIDPQELDAELDELLGDPASRSLDSDDARPPVDDEPVTAKVTIPRGARARGGSVPPPEPEPATQTELVPERVAGPESDPTPQAGSVVVSEQVRVESAPPASSVALAAATAEVPSEVSEDEVVTATIRVRFPEQEPNTARIPIDPSPPTDLQAASQAKLESATDTTAQWAVSSDAPA